MSIYTRSGDNGTTSLYGGKKVLKSDPIVEAYGSLDELSSFTGLALTKLKKGSADSLLIMNIQKDLHEIMSYLAGKKTDLEPLITRIKIFEHKIDKVQLKLPKLNSFILPNGSELACMFHILRTVCRRGERRVVALKKTTRLNLNLIIMYLNRLSDLFFVLGRDYNTDREVII